MAKQTVTLQPGESQVVTFEAIPDRAKTYQVSVDGLSGSFTAIEPLPTTRVTIEYLGVPSQYEGSIVIDGIPYSFHRELILDLESNKSHLFFLLPFMISSGYPSIERIDVYDLREGTWRLDGTFTAAAGFGYWLGIRETRIKFYLKF